VEREEKLQEIVGIAWSIMTKGGNFLAGQSVQTMLFTILAFATIMTVMSVGVVVSGKRLRGSCGGVSSDCACEKQGLEKPSDCPLKRTAMG